MDATKRIANRSSRCVYAGCLLLWFLSSCVQTQSGSPVPDSSVNDNARAVTNRPEMSLLIDVFVINQARTRAFLQAAIENVDLLYQKCQIRLRTNLHYIDSPAEQLIGPANRNSLVKRHATNLPALFVVEQTAERDVAFSYLSSPAIDTSSTSWMTNRVSDACFSWIMAHELGHVLLDSGVHSNGTNNVMSNGCKSTNWGSGKLNPAWTPTQCAALRSSPFIMRDSR